jgi:transcriptional regulator with XRE-family HTH domain
MKPEELKKIRLRLDLSQESMATRLGLHKNTVYRYETGQRPIPKVVTLAVRSLRQEG